MWRLSSVLTEYIEEALRRAHYDITDEEESYYGEVPELKGVWASGSTLEECRRNLKEVIEGWILFSIKKGMPIPRLGEFGIREIEETVL
jgi:predicted RNase H-like HicB family nuclease